MAQREEECKYWQGQLLSSFCPKRQETCWNQITIAHNRVRIAYRQISAKKKNILMSIELVLAVLTKIVFIVTRFV